MLTDFANIPQVLTNLPNWVVWKLEVRNGASTKIPYDAKKRGTYAKSNDSKTWASFDVALEAASDISNDYSGIGFMLQGTDLVGIDFDGVLRDGQAEPYVLEILNYLKSPYTEITPSGNGLRAFVRCPKLPAGQRKFSGNKYGAEIYSGSENGRYLTCTGNHFSGDGVPEITDISLAYALVSKIRDDKFKKLWMGDTSEYGEDHSRADLALLDMLAVLFNRDPERVEWAFSASKLGEREKWVGREDYRLRSIAKAVATPATQQQSTRFEPEKTPQHPPAEIILRRGDTIKPKKLMWLWWEHVPLGKITLYAGNPDNGKSLAAMDLAARVTKGAEFPHNSANPLPPSEVMMLLGEDDLDDTAVPRLIAAGADMTKIHFPDGVVRPNSTETDVRLDWDMGALEAKLDAHPEIRLLIIDPVSNYLGDKSMIAEQDARSVLIPLKRIAQRKNLAVVIVMHLNKKSELDAISRVGGAMAFIGVARCSWLFVRDASSEEGRVSDSFTMARIKNNLVKASTCGGLSYRVEGRPVQADSETIYAPVVVWGLSVEKTADDVLEEKRAKHAGPGRPTGTAPELAEAITWLERALQGAPLAEKWLVEHAKEEANISKATLERAKKALGCHSRKVKAGWLWELPEVIATASTVFDDSPVEQEGYDHVDREFDHK